LLHVPVPPFSHYGKDFLFTKTLHFDTAGSPYFLANARAVQIAGGTEFELEPALLAFFNQSHPISIEVHSDPAEVDSESLRVRSYGVIGSRAPTGAFGTGPED
jgi:hypothetical protein